MDSATGKQTCDGGFLSRPVAVTGATGMVGSHLVSELLQAGYSDITLAVRSAKRAERIYATLGRLGTTVPEGALRIVETELTDPALLVEKVGKADVVFNCAARIMSGEMTAEELISTNVAITRSVVDWCIYAGVRRMVHVSSISALGEAPRPGEPVDEGCEPENVERYAAYGRSKYRSEREVRRAAEAGMEVTVVMPGVILGEGDARGGGSAALIPAISCGQPFYTNGLMSYVDVRDVARAMVALAGMEEAASERFILSAGNLTYRELITLGARAAGRPRPFIPVGRGAIACAYGAIRAAIKLRLLRDRGITRENLGSVLRTVRYDGSKITRLYGFEYTPLTETIDRVVKYSRRRGNRR